MWKQHIVGAVIATFIIAAGISFNPFFSLVLMNTIGALNVLKR